MKSSHRMAIAGLERDLPLFPISGTLQIAAFIMFGDVELTRHCARELLMRAPAHDIMMTAEAKSIPLIYEMAAQSGTNRYIVARKAPKLYMGDMLSVAVQSITTAQPQKLFLDGGDADYLAGKRVLLVDDVISTGGSLQALEELCAQAGAQVVGRMAVLAEGDAAGRDDLIYLEQLPLFDAQGNGIA